MSNDDLIPDRDPAWLAYIRSLRCCLCGTNAKRRQAHHVARFQRNPTMGQTAPDYHAVPMCAICHASIPHGEDYGDRWPEVMEAWFPLLLEYFSRLFSIEEAF